LPKIPRFHGKTPF